MVDSQIHLHNYHGKSQKIEHKSGTLNDTFGPWENLLALFSQVSGLEPRKLQGLPQLFWICFTEQQRKQASDGSEWDNVNGGSLLTKKRQWSKACLSKYQRGIRALVGSCHLKAMHMGLLGSQLAVERKGYNEEIRGWAYLRGSIFHHQQI